MTVVEVNGQELEFPDEMQPDAIKAVLQKKFPAPAPVSLAHSAGVDTRDVLTGLSTPVALLANTAVSGINAATGKNLPMPSQGFQDSLTKMGLPTAQGRGDRLSSDVIGGGISGLAFGPVGAASGAISGGASGMVREGGGGVPAQIVTGIIAGKRHAESFQCAKYWGDTCKTSR